MLLLVTGGAAIFYSIAFFAKSASTARHLIDVEKTAHETAIDPAPTTKQQRNLTPPRFADLAAGVALPLIVVLTAPVLVLLAWQVIYGAAPAPVPLTKVTVNLRPPGAAATPPPPPQTNVAIEILRDDLVLLSEYHVVYFGVDEDDGPEIPPQIAHVVRGIMERGNDWPCEILVYGHADSQGNDAHNFDLSTRRVRTVAKLLREKLPDDIPIAEAPGGGERQQAILTADEIDAWANRRVDVSVQCRK